MNIKNGNKGEKLRGWVNEPLPLQKVCGKIQPRIYPRFTSTRRYTRHMGDPVNSTHDHIRNTRSLELNIDWRHVGFFRNLNIYCWDLLGPLAEKASTSYHRKDRQLQQPLCRMINLRVDWRMEIHDKGSNWYVAAWRKVELWLHIG